MRGVSKASNFRKSGDFSQSALLISEENGMRQLTTEKQSGHKENESDAIENGFVLFLPSVIKFPRCLKSLYLANAWRAVAA